MCETPTDARRTSLEAVQCGLGGIRERLEKLARDCEQVLDASERFQRWEHGTRAVFTEFTGWSVPWPSLADAAPSAAPDVIAQSGDDGADIDEIYARAAAALPALHAGMRKLVENAGGEFRAAPLKGIARAREKMHASYGGDARRLTDLVRAQGVFADVEGLDARLGAAAFAAAGLELVRLKMKPAEHLVNVRAAGFVGEVTFVPQAFVEGRAFQHDVSARFRRDQDRAERTAQDAAVKHALVPSFRRRLFFFSRPVVGRTVA